MTRTVVIGGGIAGLATATLLAREGHEVRLFERNTRLGGRAGVLRRDGYRFETGPSWYLMPRIFDHYFELLGTSTREQLDLVTLDPGYQVFRAPGGAESDPVAVPYGAERVAELFEELEPGSAPILRRYLASAAHATDLAERHFLYNPFTKWSTLTAAEVVRALPQLASLLGTSLQKFVSRQFQHPVLRQVLGYPAVFLGTDPRRAPAMYHLMSTLDLDEGVQYPMGGFWGLVERIASLAIESGVHVVTEAEVTRILTTQAGRKQRVSGIEWRDAAGEIFTEPADIVVSGADLHHTETVLLDASARSYPESWWKGKESGPGGVIALLGVSGKLPQLGHHSLFFTSDWDANFDAIFGERPSVPDPASLYVCKPSATEAEVAPEGDENLFVLIPVPADPEIGRGGADGEGDPAVERAVDAAIDQISAWANIPDLRERIVVRETIGPADFVDDYSSWRGGMLGPAHTLRQSAMFRPQNASKRVAGLFYAGATTSPGVGVPMCLISAELVLKRIRGDRTAGP
ncbi:phytoene desaturase [Leucobacter insecticola]|uniref:Phytoene desaturase n=1 Tax=Leucobacter insecticola TaxID=2714934 RepID=A0A6G8FJA1_9MICO|nr:phytoene desaturase family protein [Leucobacter insecticola]QIM16536.1 phytoene desaturase [Leucobacter insecticola]